jgi:hypothetical protein
LSEGSDHLSYHIHPLQTVEVSSHTDPRHKRHDSCDGLKRSWKMWQLTPPHTIVISCTTMNVRVARRDYPGSPHVVTLVGVGDPEGRRGVALQLRAYQP